MYGDRSLSIGLPENQTLGSTLLSRAMRLTLNRSRVAMTSIDFIRVCR